MNDLLRRNCGRIHGFISDVFIFFVCCDVLHPYVITVEIIIPDSRLLYPHRNDCSFSVSSKPTHRHHGLFSISLTLVTPFQDSDTQRARQTGTETDVETVKLRSDVLCGVGGSTNSFSDLKVCILFSFFVSFLRSLMSFLGGSLVRFRANDSYFAGGSCSDSSVEEVEYRVE